MNQILRGDVWWADLNPVGGREEAGKRPVLIISHHVFNARSGTVIALALSAEAPSAGFPLTMELTSPSLTRRCWVKMSQIRTLSVTHVDKKIGSVSEEELARAIEGLFEIVGD